MRLYRAYVNCFEEAPFIWQVDTGSADMSARVRDVVFIGVSGITRQNLQADNKIEPKVWLEVEAELAITDNDVAVFTSLWPRKKKRRLA